GVGRARVSAAATDLVTGEGVRCGGGVFVSASVVKADILAALLLRAQDSGRGPTAAERSLAAAMIERSDNDAASVLWRTVGSAAGLDAACARLGLTETAGGGGGYWGLTRATAAARPVLLRRPPGRAGGEGAGAPAGSGCCAGCSGGTGRGARTCWAGMRGPSRAP